MKEQSVRLVDLPRIRDHIALYLSIRDLKASSLTCRVWYATAYPLLRPFTRIQAMDVPELASMVAKYLEPNDLKACALVRRSWYDNFNPYVWSTFVLKDVPEPDPSCSCSSSSLSPMTTAPQECQAHPRCCKKKAVYKNADLIRHLVVHYVRPDSHPEEFYALFTQKCYSLRSLSLFVDSMYQDFIAHLLRENPQIGRRVSHYLIPGLSGQSSLDAIQPRVLTIGGRQDYE